MSHRKTQKKIQSLDFVGGGRKPTKADEKAFSQAIAKHRAQRKAKKAA